MIIYSNELLSILSMETFKLVRFVAIILVLKLEKIKWEPPLAFEI